MTLDAETAATVRRLFFAEHWKVGTIAAQLGLHHDTIEPLVGLTSPRRVVPVRARDTLAVPFADFVAETLARYPRLRATRLFDMLKGRGYTGSVRTLRRYVQRVRPVARRDAFLRLEPFVGEQAQIDWAFVGDRDVPGGRRGLWLFLMVLAWSRMLFAEFVWDLTAASLRRSLIHAHTFFEGSPRQWLFDNPKTIVLGRDGNAVRFHPAVLELSSAFCVQPRLCNVRAPQEKGRVERAVRYVRERFLDGREIRDVIHGNRELVAFLRDVAPARPHPRLSSRTVGDAFAEERPKLLALPEAMPSGAQSVPVAIDGTAFAHFDTNLYSVPPEWAGRTLTLVADDAQVRLLDGTTEVAAHPRSWGRKQVRRPPRTARCSWSASAPRATSRGAIDCAPRSLPSTRCWRAGSRPGATWATPWPARSRRSTCTGPTPCARPWPRPWRGAPTIRARWACCASRPVGRRASPCRRPSTSGRT